MSLLRCRSALRVPKRLLASGRFASNSLTTDKLESIRRRNAPVDIHPEVEDALATGKPVVALETAIVTHGMAPPLNVDLSIELEEIIKSTGAIPAMIGLIEGRAKIGLKRDELERLGSQKCTKISRRDLAPAIAMKTDGGTTISATMILSAFAGIKVFATGGLGGVHRGGESSMDISADLQDLTRCPVGVVSSGVKSILDIGRTLEYLETLGVPTLSYGNSKEFPAFFTRRSGFQVPWNVNTPMDAAKILYTQWQFGMENGALIAVPIPEQHEADGESIQRAIEQAIEESERNGVSKQGKDATPWLLKRVAELTNSASLTSNVALIKNTAQIGGQIAVQYQKLANENVDFTHSPVIQSSLPFHSQDSGIYNKPDEIKQSVPANLVVIGSAGVDITARAQPEYDATRISHSTAPGNISLSLGGVARNIAEASHRTMKAIFPTLSSLLIAPVGDDAFGRLLVDETVKAGMRTDGLLNSKERTAVCNMVLDDKGTLIGGIADMDITSGLKPDTITSQLQKCKPTIVALDGNLSPDAISAVVDYCLFNGIKVFFEPTSIIKSTSVLPAVLASLNKYPDHIPITFCSPNELELAQLYRTARSDPYDLMSRPAWWTAIDGVSLGSAYRMDLEQLAKKKVDDQDDSKGTLAYLIDQGIAQMAVNLLPFFQHLIIKCGERGVLLAMLLSNKDGENSEWRSLRSNPHRRYIVAHGKSKTMILHHFPALPIEKIVSVTGAGDSFVGVLLAYLVRDLQELHKFDRLKKVITFAQSAAILSLQSSLAVSPLLPNKDGNQYVGP